MTSGENNKWKQHFGISPRGGRREGRERKRLWTEAASGLMSWCSQFWVSGTAHNPIQPTPHSTHCIIVGFSSSAFFFPPIFYPHPLIPIPSHPTTSHHHHQPLPPLPATAKTAYRTFIRSSMWLSNLG
ncbi:hypothetical protein BO82DRAFT_162352 [Aspergillus uvarum CBS 121591]|uniref:Uncharacterized protein n=1 Tax=Aspergillus uvarum CBS 121591 TaxID=1448315 RepID=A0A319CIN1_9EURO|nr:hypothetical protein BO82DRAFT_162352 [Aspergillus uvarum CBS 121591]PYH85515.1 hypothetical protein BO82DRAFT_162352 [Aspergillus uvarum CBS 121591]